MNLARFSIPLPESLQPADGGFYLRVKISDRGLRELSLTRGSPAATQGLDEMKDPARARAWLSEIKEMLQARWKGKRADMAWSEFDLSGRADFHVRVWKAMYEIPFGETATYAEVAASAGSPLAFRACGQACGANPIILLIPCHRVVSSTGIGGFGSGLDWKKKFLALEGVDASQFSAPRGTRGLGVLLPR